MSSTAHLPKPADPAQMSEWRRETCGVTATTYYPERATIIVRPATIGNIAECVLTFQRGARLFGHHRPGSTFEEAETAAALEALETLKIEVKP